MSSEVSDGEASRELRSIFSDLPGLILVTELAEFLADLQEARDILSLAIAENDDRPRPEGLFDALVASAIVAYWRCFMVSKRRGLHDLVPIPAEMAAMHERSRLMRNRAIAHSDSERLMAVSTVILSKCDGEITYVGLGRAIAVQGVGVEFEDTRRLVSSMIDLTEAALEKAESDFESSLRGMNMKTLWNSPEIDFGEVSTDIFRDVDPSSGRRVVRGAFRVKPAPSKELEQALMELLAREPD